MHTTINNLRHGALVSSLILAIGLVVCPMAGAQAPEDEQLKFWLPDGARIQQRLTMPHNIVTRVQAPAPPEEVLAFYEQRFDEEGWTLVSVFELEGSYTLLAIKGRRDATLNIDPDGAGGSRVRASVSRTDWDREAPEEPPVR